jgi:Ca2+-binding EF-hand superfamily protein
LSTL